MVRVLMQRTRRNNKTKKPVLHNEIMKIESSTMTIVLFSTYKVTHKLRIATRQSHH